MSLQQRITGILQKINDPDTVVIAEKEIKALIINEVDDGEKLSTLINCIGDERDAMAQKNRKGRYNQLKFFIAISEIFQHQILEFLPRIFSILNKKVRDGDAEIAEIIADTYGGITEFAYRGADEQDATYVFNESLSLLSEIIEKGGKTAQNTAAMCLTKIVQNCAIETLKTHFEMIYDAMEQLLSLSTLRAPFHIFECVLSLILSVQEKIEHVVASLPSLLVKFIADEDFKTRKMCIDIFYSILVINKALLTDVEGNIYELLQNCKSDKNKAVREAAVECLKLVKPSPSARDLPKAKVEVKNDSRHAKKPSGPPEPVVQNRSRVVSNKKIPFINQKIDLEHVHSTIDKTKINRHFVKQAQQQEDTVVLFKEPRIQIESDRILNNPLPANSGNNRPIEFSGNKKNANAIVEESPPTPRNNDRFKDNLGDVNRAQPEPNNFTFNNRNVRGESPGPAPAQNQNKFMTAEPAKNNFTEGAFYDANKKPQFRAENPFGVDQALGPEHYLPDVPGSHRPVMMASPDLAPMQGYQNQTSASEVGSLKMHINSLNNKISDMQTIIMNLQNNNGQLATRVFGMERELYEIRALLQSKGNRQAHDHHNSFKNYGRVQEEATFYQPDYALKYGQYPPTQQDNRADFYKPQEPPAYPNAESFGFPNQPPQNKWLAKSNTSINDTLFEILSLENPMVQESQVVAFLRTISNLKMFQTLEQTLLDKLLEKILGLITKNIENNLILVEYLIKWIEKYVSAGKITEPMYISRLYSALIYVQNKLEDEIISNKIITILNNPIFKGLMRNSIDAKGTSQRAQDVRNQTGRTNFENYKNLGNQSPKYNRAQNQEEFRQEHRYNDEVAGLQNFDSQVIDFNAKFDPND